MVAGRFLNGAGALLQPSSGHQFLEDGEFGQGFLVNGFCV